MNSPENYGEFFSSRLSWSLDAWHTHLLRIDFIGPGRSTILPTVPHPLPVVYAPAIVYLVPFYPVNDVVDVHKPSF